MYIYTYIHICIYTYTCIHIYIYTYIDRHGPCHPDPGRRHDSAEVPPACGL